MSNYGLDTTGLDFGEALQTLEDERQAGESRNYRVGDLVMCLLEENEQLPKDEQVTKRWIAEEVGMQETMLNLCWKVADLLPYEVRVEVLPLLPRITWSHCYTLAADFAKKHGYPGDPVRRVQLAIEELEHANDNELSTRKFRDYLRHDDGKAPRQKWSSYVFEGPNIERLLTFLFILDVDPKNLARATVNVCLTWKGEDEENDGRD